MGLLKKESFLFCFYCTEKFSNLIRFWYYLEDKSLNYQVIKENKPKFKFLSPKIKYNQKAQKSKLRADCSSNFQSTPSNLPFLAKNSHIFQEEYKITVVDKMLIINISKIQIFL